MSHCEVNIETTVSSLLPLRSELIGWSYEQVTASSRCEIQTHGELTARSQCETVSSVSCVVDEWLQNELALSFRVSLQCVSCTDLYTGQCMVSCELKFYTGNFAGYWWKKLWCTYEHKCFTIFYLTLKSTKQLCHFRRNTPFKINGKKGNGNGNFLQNFVKLIETSFTVEDYTADKPVTLDLSCSYPAILSLDSLLP